MPHEAPQRIRNVALVGHRGSGKTSLNEALLFEAGAINRLGSVADGSTVSDSAPDEKAREMSIASSLASFKWQDRKINLVDTPGEPSFVADALAALRVCEGAVFVVNAVMGVEVTTERLWERAADLELSRLVFVNMLDRERADFFRTLESLKSSFGQHVVATEIPIGAEHDVARRDRPRGHEGLRVRRRLEGQLQGDPDPGRPPGAGRGVPGEADGRGRRGLRRADGALPRGRGDLARGDRERAEERRHERHRLPGHLRRGHEEPGDQPPARRAGRGPALACQEGRLPRRRPRHRGRGRGRHDRLRVQDAGGSVRRQDQPDARLPRGRERGHAALQLPRARQGADGPAARAAGQGDGAHRRAGRGRHRRGREAEGDPRRRRPRLEGRAGRDRAARPARSRDGVRDRAEAQGRRGQGLHRAAPAPGGGPDDRRPPRRPDRASRSWRGSPRSTSR